MSEVVTNVQKPRGGISKKKFYAFLTLVAITIIAIYMTSYFTGKFWKPVTQSLTFNPGPPTYLYSITGQGRDGILSKPMAVAVINKLIYVSDAKNNRVQVFDYNGKSLTMFGKKGTGQGEFNFPYGIAGDAQNNVYVADLNNGNIQVFTREGKFVKYFAKDNIGNPSALFFRDGKLYVSDMKSDSIKVFDTATEKKLLEFGTSGSKAGQFKAANGVTVTSNRIYVSDTDNDRIQVFDLNGKYQFTIDGSVNGRNPRTLTSRGIGVDGRGVVYDASLMGNYVAGYDANGKYLWSIGSMGTDDGQFYLPNGLFVDDQGRIYVTDEGNSKVTVFEN